MTELAFARSFLTTLDARPSKLSPSHFEDPKTYPPRGAVRFPFSTPPHHCHIMPLYTMLTAPQFILPKNPKPLPKRQKLSPGSERALTITLRSARNPPLEIVLKQQSPLLSILELKHEVAQQASIPVEKIKVLHKKKPVGDAKVVRELVGAEDAEVEFAIMVMGGAASVVRREKEEKDERLPSTAVGASGKEVLQTEQFWADLRGFLTQRLKDEAEGERMAGLFREAWGSNGGVS